MYRKVRCHFNSGRFGVAGSRERGQGFATRNPEARGAAKLMRHSFVIKK